MFYSDILYFDTLRMQQNKFKICLFISNNKQSIQQKEAAIYTTLLHVYTYINSNDETLVN